MQVGGGTTREARFDPQVYWKRLAHWEQGISASADRGTDALPRHKYAVLFLFSSLYLLATCFRAYRKLFWFDELFTLYISRLPDMASVWSALKQGVDFNPPLFYAVIRFSESLFGEGHIATRLPAILGFLIFCLCLFRFVSARTSVLAGLIAMLFPLVTTAYFYAYEARSHGIVLGFGGIALVCWQEATRSRRSGWWLVGLFLALLCAILTHTYAILIIVPFVLAELVRSLFLRSVDWAVWLAIVSSSSGVMVSLPLLRASRGALPSSFYPATVTVLGNSYQSHLEPAVGVLALSLILYSVFKFVSPGTPAAPKREPSLEVPEVVVLLAFVAMPLFTFIVAKVTGAPFLYRYSISTVIGFACLLGIAAAKRTPVGIGVVLILVAQIGINLHQYARTDTLAEPTSSTALPTRSDAFESLYEAIDAIPPNDSPIVLVDYHEFLPIMHYAPAKLASRLVYVVFTVSDINGVGYLRLQRLCGAPGRVETLSDFLSTHDTFTAHCKAKSFYRISYLIQQGAAVRIERILGDSFLVSVTFNKKQGEAGASSLH